MVNQNNSSQESEKSPSDDDKNLINIAQYVKDVQQSHKRSIPPLDQWHPKHCGKMDLIIKANGEWWHEGQLMKRQSMLDLFSSVLWQEAGKFYLKTPVEQIEIEVEDAPLLVNRVEQVQIDGQAYLQLTTTNQDMVLVDDAHPIFMQEYAGERRPYVHVRCGLHALIQRQVFYHLVELGQLDETPDGKVVLTLKSGDLLLHLDS